MAATGATASDGPPGMRAAMAGYVRAAHAAYLEAAALLAPADAARLPLVAAAPLTVIAVGTSNLHVFATTEALPAPTGPEVAVEDAVGTLTWTLRFYDPVVLPALGLLDESGAPDPDGVRRLVGVRTCVYHLVVPPGGSLTAHHASHAGTGLCHGHAAAARDFDRLRAYRPDAARAIDEMQGAAVAGLVVAHALLACRIAPGDAELEGLAADDRPDPDAVRRLLLAAVTRR